MKRSRAIASVFAAGTLLASCTTTKWQMQTACPGNSTADIISGLTALVAQEGMNVTQVNEKIGLLQASSAEEHSIWTGLYTANHWTFTIRNDTIYGMAKQTATSKNAFGGVISTSETYYNDKVHRDHSWYWNVRNGLESLCEDQTIIWVKKK